MFRSCFISKTSYLRIISKRFLNLQEYQSKQLLDRKGCRIQRFVVAENIDEVCSKLESFTQKEYVVKAQILAGGRGKGRFIDGPSDLGGVFITEDKKAVIGAAKKMIGKRLVTKQTGANGVLVNSVMIAESVPIKRETYVAILMDRDSNGPVVVCSFAGGMDIEEVAQKTPDYIFKVSIDINIGITAEQCQKIAEFLKFKGELQQQAANEIKKLYELFIEVDATQIEINPFAETSDNRIFSIDAKFNFDDSAFFRQKEVFAMDNHEGQDPREIEAKKYHLNYIQMDGNIACLVNGAGLAMATMDIIKYFGGSPANFLDVGGAVTEDQVFHAFKIITSDTNVKGILINIFGGIVNCATIANGLIQALKKIRMDVPLVVRLEGTNVDAARELLKNSGLPIIAAMDLEQAAQKIVSAVESKREQASA